MPRTVPFPRAVFVLLLAGLAAWSTSCDGDNPERVTVRIDGLAVEAEVVRTPEERAQGLSGRASLPADAGMLFVLEKERVPSFWMRGMRFPLDFIWISADGRVAALTENVPPAQPGVPDQELPRYRPDSPVLYVLEVNAGVVQETSVKVGAAVTFEPEIAETPAP